ncbi:MAG: bifunctional pyr operon transcriptional regulator/uracil phosphoribosyltransferase PyrR [Blastochloris sp.]|nr:bifunctional pyr operon transcriptional regulator/uracil phosphoribosyltransferase PyrR [Blastochloris sp.]
MKNQIVLDSKSIERALNRVAHEILESVPDHFPLGFVGIHTRGIPLAYRLQSLCAKFEPGRPVLPVGKLDITFHRDDLSKSLPLPKETEIPFDISDQMIILVDDVLFTGRTISAALNALVDLGRPKTTRLAVLVDRGHRELPIRADYVGKNLPTSLDQSVKVKLLETDGTEDEVQLL